MPALPLAVTSALPLDCCPRLGPPLAFICRPLSSWALSSPLPGASGGRAGPVGAGPGQAGLAAVSTGVEQGLARGTHLGYTHPHRPLDSSCLPSQRRSVCEREAGCVRPGSMWEAGLHLLDSRVIPCHPSDKSELGCDPILEAGTFGSEGSSSPHPAGRQRRWGQHCLLCLRARAHPSAPFSSTPAQAGQRPGPWGAGGTAGSAQLCPQGLHRHPAGAQAPDAPALHLRPERGGRGHPLQLLPLQGL